MPLKASGTLAWATGCARPAPIVGMRGHSALLKAWRALAGLEHPAAQALAEAARLERLQVLGRDAAVGGEAKVPVLVVLEEDPGRLETETVEESVERAVEDRLDVLLTVQPCRDVRQDPELPLPTLNGVLQLAHRGGIRLRSHGC